MFKRLAILAIALVMVVFSAAAQADNGKPNDPAVNPDANACYTGGSLAGKCDWPTEAEDEWAWNCGWYVIRAEAGILNSIPETCGELEAQIDEFAGVTCEALDGFNVEVGFFPMDRCVGFYIAYDDWFQEGDLEYIYTFGEFATCAVRAGYTVFSGPQSRDLTSFDEIFYPQIIGSQMCTYELIGLFSK